VAAKTLKSKLVSSTYEYFTLLRMAAKEIVSATEYVRQETANIVKEEISNEEKQEKIVKMMSTANDTLLENIRTVTGCKIHFVSEEVQAVSILDDGKETELELTDGEKDIITHAFYQRFADLKFTCDEDIEATKKQIENTAT